MTSYPIEPAYYDGTDADLYGVPDDEPARMLPVVGATGTYDGEFVSVVRHTANAVWFRPMNNNREFPIYDADWDELAPRLVFSSVVYGPRYSTLWS